MTDLVDEFFKRDLTEAEAQALEGLLEKSPEEALKFAGKLRMEYAATGLPEPRVPKSFGPAASKAGGALLKGFFAVAALAGASVIAWWMWPKPQAATNLSIEKPAAPQILPRHRAPLPPPPVEVPRRLTGSPVEGNRLSVVVELDQPAPVQVRILDPRDQVVRRLYEGNLQAGKWSLHWDGLLSDGSQAPAGNYRIQVKSGSTEMSKAVAIEPGK